MWSHGCRTLNRLVRGLSAAARLDLDLYRDVAPFALDALPEAVAFAPLREPDVEGQPEPALPPLLRPTERRLDQANISESFFLVNKRPGELLDDMTLRLSKTFSARRFVVASSGHLDVLASGITLLCCGKSLDDIRLFDQWPHSYKGILKLGQVSQSFDLKTPVHARFPWEHITDMELQEASRELVGDLLLTPAPVVALRSKIREIYYVLRKEADRPEHPVTIRSFELERKASSSSEVHFKLVCDGVLFPGSLVHSLGERLGCGALLYDLERTAIGEYGAEDAWDYSAIQQAFKESRRGVNHLPEDAEEVAKSLLYQGYVPRVVGRNWVPLFREKLQKMKPFELRRRKAERLEMEREGLITDEEIMKRKLKKKAVKLVANLNVPDIEAVYARMQEE